MALDGIRMPDGCYADGTWELKMHVTDLNRDVSPRVTGEIHIGGVMLKLVEKLGTYIQFPPFRMSLQSPMLTLTALSLTHGWLTHDCSLETEL